MKEQRGSWNIGEIALLFLKLGIIGFGGPAAHIAMMEEEVVSRRKWVPRAHFLDLVGATNLIPGPNSTEMAIHLGYIRAGWPGMLAAGVCFILPAALITIALAWVYLQFGALPGAAPFLAGIKPAVLAVILAAIWRLGRSASKSWRHLLIGGAVGGASLLGMNEILALLLGGVAGLFWLYLPARSSLTHGLLPLFGLGVNPNLASIFGSGPIGQLLNGAEPIALWRLGLFFLKIGSVLYGSGYVLVAFLQGGLVDDLGWLSQQQLLDAIAIGQFTPGPVLTTATFIGYFLLGLPGASVATLAIFAPSFVFVVALNRLIPRLRDSALSGAFLDAVNISAVGLMAAVMVELGREVLTNPAAWAIALSAAALGLRWKVSATWLVLGGALLGWFLL